MTGEYEGKSKLASAHDKTNDEPNLDPTRLTLYQIGNFSQVYGLDSRVFNFLSQSHCPVVGWIGMGKVGMDCAIIRAFARHKMFCLV